VLFVCVGNSCRSQMAEGFARKYGAGVVEAQSAGLYPANSVSRLTRKIMEERGVDLSGHYPKGVSEVPYGDFGLVVNISGFMLPEDTTARVLHWEVQDPMGETAEVYMNVADQLERLVRDLVAELKNEQNA